MLGRAGPRLSWTRRRRRSSPIRPDDPRMGRMRMKTFHRALLSLAATVVLACLAAVPGAAELSWPATELAHHARAWFDMLRADEAAARAFLSEHMAPSALAEA